MGRVRGRKRGGEGTNICTLFLVHGSVTQVLTLSNALSITSTGTQTAAALQNTHTT